MERKFVLVIFLIHISTECWGDHNKKDSRPWREKVFDMTSVTTRSSVFDASKCFALPLHLRFQVQSYRTTIKSITEFATNGPMAGETYKNLAKFVDTHGPRVSGSMALENSLDDLEYQMKSLGMENVHSESVKVPKWLRGDEYAELISPRSAQLKIIGLSNSVPTPKDGITAPVFVTWSFDHLNSNKDKLLGKIVVYNSATEAPYHSMYGASEAAKYGAVGVLTRSATHFSLYTPHAGVQFYDRNESIPKIPAATLTLEDADMITRMAERGEPIKIRMVMETIASEISESRNLIGDYKGSSKPDEYLMLAGHVDSWDVGEGVLDDGVGPMLALETIRLFQTMGLRPKRTIRNAFFTAEEAGFFGALKFVERNYKELSKYTAALEADYGCLAATGLMFNGDQMIGCVLEEILNVMNIRNENRLIHVDQIPTDVNWLYNASGVPSIILNGDDGRYFWYHHTDADTIHAINSKTIDKCLALWASTAYVIADLNESLPKKTYF